MWDECIKKEKIPLQVDLIHFKSLFFVACVILFFSAGFFNRLNAGVRSALDSIKIIRIKSDSQKVLNKDLVVLEGEVEVLLDYKMHIVAEKIELDKKNQTIVAHSSVDGNACSAFVKLENPDLLMLAEHIELDLKNRTGFAKNIKIHVKEGFLSSSTARKIDDKTWEMDHIKYTSCDRATPHWAFVAHSAKLFKNSVLKASGLLFKILGVPVFLFPGLVFPLQNRAGSGFLIPRISFDPELGFGFKQEYYALIGPHCDNTAGFNFIQKKGFIFSDEFRWARSAENFLIMNGYYAEEWNAILEKKGKIISSKDKHYWVQGDYFQPIKNSGGKDTSYVQSLFRFDFGTDKTIGYHFLNDELRVEDSFLNTAIIRSWNRKNTVDFFVHSERASRRQSTSEIDSPSWNVIPFLDEPAIQKEREEKTFINYLPRFESNSFYYEILPQKHKHLFHRHNFLVDYATLHSKNRQKLYGGNLQNEVIRSLASPEIDVETMRVLYHGQVKFSKKFLNQNVSAFFDPHLHFRSKVKRNGNKNKSKMFYACGAEMAFSEKKFYYNNFSYRPIISWNYMPKFDHEHWFYIDKSDRFYPENRFDFTLRGNFFSSLFDVDLQVVQGYDFNGDTEIFPLRRDHVAGREKFLAGKLLPLKISVDCSYSGESDPNDFLCCAQLVQEYAYTKVDSKNIGFSLIQSEVLANFSWKKYEFYLACLYQKRSLLSSRRLFSEVATCSSGDGLKFNPFFANLGFSFPLGKELNVSYDGSFYAKQTALHKSWLSPLSHRLRLRYDGHCWGTTLGFEEKRYRQSGKWKSERAITLALSLKSIGSFAQKFRRPVIHKAPHDYA